MTVLITGATGFSGSYLDKAIKGNKLLLARTIPVAVTDTMDYIQCDLLDIESINKVIKDKQPEKIFHIAGSFTNEYETDYKANVTITKNILDAVKNFSPSSRVLLVGSAAEYGLLSKENSPVSELSPLRPFNVYGLTKINQKVLMDYYVNTFSLDIVMARPFNLYGKGISSRLFIGKVYEEIESLKSGKISEISLGNLDAQRDYISIDNAVQHYIKIMDKGVVGEVYNVASGKPTKIKNILNKILDEENIDLSIVKANTRAVQANDSDIIFADISKLEGLYNE
jgi:GDP-4-dehydro-6-deoxy-D-mannose reductase